LHAKRHRVTIGAAVSFGKELEEKDRREHRTDDEESADDQDAQHAVPHGALSYRRFSTSTHGSTYATSFSIRSITTSSPAVSAAPSSPTARIRRVSGPTSNSIAASPLDTIGVTTRARWPCRT